MTGKPPKENTALEGNELLLMAYLRHWTLVQKSQQVPRPKMDPNKA